MENGTMKEKFMYERVTKNKIVILSAILFCAFISVSTNAQAQGLFDDDFLGSSVPEASPATASNEVAPLPAISSSKKADAKQKAKEKTKKEEVKKELSDLPTINNVKKSNVKKTKIQLAREKIAKENAKKAAASKPAAPKADKSIFENAEKKALSVPKAKSTVKVPSETSGADSFLNTPKEKKKASKNKKSDMVFSSIQKAASKRPSQALLGRVSTELFRQMADIERQNALLALQLKREGLRSEIEAIKRQRRLALQEEISKKEEDRRKQLEWENEQEKEKLDAKRKIEDEKNKLMIEQLKKNLEQTEKSLTAQIKNLEAEKEKQVAALKAEKESSVNDLRTEIEKLKEENKKIKRNANSKIMALAEAAKKKGLKLAEAARKTTSVQKRQIADLKRKLQARINELSLLNKKNIELVEMKEIEKQKALENAENKIESDDDDDDDSMGMEIVTSYSDSQTPAEELYAVLEVRGSRKDVVAKLLTKDGLTFLVKKGTILSSGHKVVDIQKNHIKVSKGGRLELIGFPAGGVVDREPTTGSVMSKKTIGNVVSDESTPNWQASQQNVNSDNEATTEAPPPPPVPTYSGNPSGMMVNGRPGMPGMR
jgi:type IV pilus biogenesis protein PilP